MNNDATIKKGYIPFGFGIVIRAHHNYIITALSCPWPITLFLQFGELFIFREGLHFIYLHDFHLHSIEVNTKNIVIIYFTYPYPYAIVYVLIYDIIISSEIINFKYYYFTPHTSNNLAHILLFIIFLFWN